MKTNQKLVHYAGDPQAMVRFEKSLRLIQGRVAKLAKELDENVSDLELLIEAAHAICDLELVAGPMPPKKGPPLIVAAC